MWFPTRFPGGCSRQVALPETGGLEELASSLGRLTPIAGMWQAKRSTDESPLTPQCLPMPHTVPRDTTWQDYPTSGAVYLQGRPAFALLVNRPTPAAGAIAEETPASHQIWPVDPLATGNETPVGPLRRCPVRQTREPRKWHGDRPAIRKFRDQSIVAHTYALGQCFPEFSPRSTHAMTSTKKPRFPRP